MLRLRVRSHSPVQVVLEVHGWVSGEAVPLLEQEGERWLGQSEQLVLLLHGVRFLDRDGLELLRRWSGERLVLRGGSSFVRQLLESHGLDSQELRTDDPVSC